MLNYVSDKQAVSSGKQQSSLSQDFTLHFRLMESSVILQSWHVFSTEYFSNTGVSQPLIFKKFAV